MRLQRIAFHRVVRILSGILPVLVVAFVGVAAWNYWASTRDVAPAPMRRPEMLPADVSIRANDFRYSPRTGDTLPYEIFAEKLIVETDETSFFEGVDVTVYPQREGDPVRHIRGDRCSSDKTKKQVHCTGNVSIELDSLTTAYTEEMHYDSKAHLISSPVPTRLERPRHMTGSAGQMQYFEEAKLLRLTKEVVIDLVEGGGLRTGVAVFSEMANWVTVSQGIEMTSANGWIRGGSGRADLAPGTYRPTKVVIENGAAMESRSPSSLFTMNSEWLQSDLSPEGKAEHVLARGKVVAVNTPKGEDKSLDGELEGPEIEAWLNETGRPETIEARQNPSFQSKQATLTAANTIRIDHAARSVKTQGVSVLTSQKDGRETSSISGRDFTILGRQDSREFSTLSRAQLKSSDMTTRANTTTAVIDEATNKIVSLVQTGAVELEDKVNKFEGKAGRLTMRDGGDIVLEGDSPEVKEGQRILKAQTITLRQESKTFIGVGNVTMAVLASDSRQIVVKAAKADGREDQIDFTGGVELYPGSGKIESQTLVAYPNTDRFVAEGNVSSKGADFRATSNRLEVTDSGAGRQTAHYTGKVTATRTDKQGVALVIRTEDLVVQLKSGEMERLIAIKGVDIAQGAQWKGHGDSVDYDVVTGDIVLKGSGDDEAEVRRGEEFSRGCTITVKLKGGERVDPCAGRSVTSKFKPQK